MKVLSINIINKVLTFSNNTLWRSIINRKCFSSAKFQRVGNGIVYCLLDSNSLILFIALPHCWKNVCCYEVKWAVLVDSWLTWTGQWRWPPVVSYRLVRTVKQDCPQRFKSNQLLLSILHVILKLKFVLY